MPEIISIAEISRLAAKSTPSTRSSSPGPSSSFTASPSVQPGALSPPPPNHYLRNKASVEDNEKALKLLRKRSEIYDRDRDRVRRSGASRTPPRRSAPEGLLFQHDHFQSAHLESDSNTGITVLQDGVGSTSPMLSSSRQWAFLGVDPMSPPLTSTSKKHRIPKDGIIPKSPRPHSANDGSPGEPFRSLSGSVDSHTSTSHSRRGSLPERDLAQAAIAPMAHRPSFNRYHSGRHAGSDSSISVSSHASSSIFPPSLDPCSRYSPPVLSASLPPFTSGGPQIIPHTSSVDSEGFSPISFAHPHSPQSAPALFDVQKRRRAHAFDHFTSYNERLPFDGRNPKHKRQPSNIHGEGSQVSESLDDVASSTDARTLHSMRSAPDFKWREGSPELDQDLEDGLEKMDIKDTLQGQDAPRRNPACRVIAGLKSILTSKSGSPRNPA